MPPLITLLTDFGTRDGYVGAMKGVLHTLAPTATLVDITHHVAAQDVLAGAFALAQAAPYFPAGTIHVAVVDPGVGSARRALIVEHGKQLFVGPENGLLWLAAPEPAWVVDRVPPEWAIHPTFHGRDLFARIAARLAMGDRPTVFATERRAHQPVAMPATVDVGTDRVGEIIHIDRFGNLVTNLVDAPDSGAMVEVDGLQAAAGNTYSDVEPGRLVAYRGSSGYLEIAVRDGSAQALLGATRGVRVRLHRRA